MSTMGFHLLDTGSLSRRGLRGGAQATSAHFVRWDCTGAEPQPSLPTGTAAKSIGTGEGGHSARKSGTGGFGSAKLPRAGSGRARTSHSAITRLLSKLEA